MMSRFQEPQADVVGSGVNSTPLKGFLSRSQRYFNFARTVFVWNSQHVCIGSLLLCLSADGRKRATAPRSDKGAPQREPYDTLPLSPEPAADVVGPGVFPPSPPKQVCHL